MVNSRDRALLARAQAVLSEMGTLRPGNPAHTAAIFAHSPVLVECSRDLTKALGSLAHGDDDGYEWADSYLTDAEERLARHRERVIPEPGSPRKPPGMEHGEPSC